MVECTSMECIAGKTLRGECVEVYEGSVEVLHHRQSRGPPAGQDDRPGAQQVRRDVSQGGRAAGAHHGQARLRPDVLI